MVEKENKVDVLTDLGHMQYMCELGVKVCSQVSKC